MRNAMPSSWYGYGGNGTLTCLPTNICSIGGWSRYRSRSLNRTVSPVGSKRRRGFDGGGLAVTVGGAGRSTDTGTGGFGGGSVASPGGTGNFQPSVVTGKDSLPSGRTQGASVNNRPSRTPAGARTAKRGSA